jgi:hypothetical protein
MPRATLEDRHTGIIDANRYYTLEAAKRECGFGKPQVEQATAAGVVTIIPMGNYRYIAGHEIIAWLEHIKSKLKAKPKDHAELEKLTA